MTKTWQVQDARARFSELLKMSLAEGPQIVTRRGVETAVLVPIDQWRRLEKMDSPDLKELLLAPEARTDSLTPPRETHLHRVPSVLG
ncbi:MAG: type II toxin-antitoxin system Phd/YefM family antitoxin [Gemmatimonadetes bacterium]|nr:type II toxin-antitoxin system Phd/YefM family antitoxin [Gemmatimonadota bacterium]MYB56759.1 type II toxin-antitoxin system Phd/YefM family antitoxin [Gemmatimonadota bacterium]